MKTAVIPGLAAGENPEPTKQKLTACNLSHSCVLDVLPGSILWIAPE